MKKVLLILLILCSCCLTAQLTKITSKEASNIKGQHPGEYKTIAIDADNDAKASILDAKASYWYEYTLPADSGGGDAKGYLITNKNFQPLIDKKCVIRIMPEYWVFADVFGGKLPTECTAQNLS